MLVQRLIDAGAIVIGKVNLDQLATVRRHAIALWDGPMSCCTVTTLIDGRRMFIPSRDPPVVIHDQYIGLLTALYDVFGAGRPIAAKLVKAAARKSKLLWFALDGGVDNSTYISKKITRTRRSRDRRRRAQTRQDAFDFTSQRDGLGF